MFKLKYYIRKSNNEYNTFILSFSECCTEEESISINERNFDIRLNPTAAYNKCKKSMIIILLVVNH